MKWLKTFWDTLAAPSRSSSERDMIEVIFDKTEVMIKYIETMHMLFDKYHNSFGLSSEEHRLRTCEYDDLFCGLQCMYLGHDIREDQCGKPEHDYCSRCEELRVKLGVPDPRGKE